MTVVCEMALVLLLLLLLLRARPWLPLLRAGLVWWYRPRALRRVLRHRW